MVSRPSSLVFGLVVAVMVGVGAWAVPAEAQDRDAVMRLASYGRMSEREAAKVIARVNQGLAENAARGGFRYDRLRERVARTLYADPGKTREEYQGRLGNVLLRMRAGVDGRLLEALFPAKAETVLECVADYPLTMAACDALVAAAWKRPSVLPYLAPDAGKGLVEQLTLAGAPKKRAEEVADALGGVMLGVGRMLGNDPRSADLTHLLQSCPGSLATRDAQIRAWNIGPTVPLARCIATQIARRGPSAAFTAQLLLGMEKEAAQTFLLWGAPSSMTSAMAAASVDTGVSVENVLKVARAHFQAGRFQEAAAVYEQASRMDPTSSRALAGLGSARLRAGDIQGGVAALEQAVRVHPRNATLYAILGEALVKAGRIDHAEKAYKMALKVEPKHPEASRGLAGIGDARRLYEAKAWRAKGRLHFLAKQYKIAAGAYEKATLAEPTHAGAHAGLGAARLGLKDTAGAVVAYKKAVELSPKNASHWTQLAAALQATGEQKGAVAALEKALAIDPKNARAKAGMKELTAKAAEATGTGDGSAGDDSLVDSILADPLLDGEGAEHVAADAASASLESIEGAAAPADAPAPPATTTAAQVAAPKAAPAAASTGAPTAGAKSAAPATPVGAPSPEDDALMADLAGDGAAAGAAGGAPAAGDAPGASGTPETPSRDEIATALRAKKTGVGACAPGIHGVVVTTVTVEGKTGAVVDVTVKQGPKALEGRHKQCISSAVRGATFPVFLKPSLTVDFPFTL